MASGKESRKVRVFDFDDTLFDRGELIRCGGLIGGLLHSHKLSSLTLEDISQLEIDRHGVDTPVKGLRERISLAVHARRKVYPGVREGLERIHTEGVLILGNTGRPQKKEWIDITEKGLGNAGILDYFTDIFYTPDGVPIAVSKAQVILMLTQAYENVKFDEDDPRTALFIARLFPNVQVNLVQHGLTGLLVSSRELAELPNLKRVAVFGKK